MNLYQARHSTDTKIHQLILERYRHLHVSLALNPSISRQLQIIFLHDPSLYVRGSLALNSKLIDEFQIVLAQDSSSFVQECLVLNRNLLPETYRFLYSNFKDVIYKKVSENYYSEITLAKIRIIQLLE